MNPVKPDPNTYWVIPGKFLAGEYPGDPFSEVSEARIDRFIESGVSFFIDLTEPFELPSYQQFLEGRQTPSGKRCEYCNLPIPDLGGPAVGRMREIQDAIAAALKAGHTVYVHCWGGIGRTGTTVGCFLVEQGQDGDGALSRVRYLFSQTEKSVFRPHSPETDEQRQFVRSWGRKRG